MYRIYIWSDSEHYYWQVYRDMKSTQATLNFNVVLKISYFLSVKIDLHFFLDGNVIFGLKMLELKTWKIIQKQ